MRLGILGGGQLGRMLALAAVPLGIRCRVLEPAASPPAAAVAAVLPTAYDDPDGLRALAAEVDVVTVEFENVPAAALRVLRDQVPVLPGETSLATAQDRRREKELFAALGIATPTWAPVDDRDGLVTAVERIGLPAVLKTRRLGYDGKGQHVLRAPGDVDRAWAALGGVPLLLEALVPFTRELSVVAVRARDGSIRSYPLVENRHREGILRLTLAPAPDADDVAAEADRMVRLVLERLGHVGVLALELFEVDGRLLANEIAPRVHNSGHWTIEGAATSQFENHVRAVTGLPLGDTSARGRWGMVNLIGTTPALDGLLAVPGANVHLYDKEPRPGRKLGHVTTPLGPPLEALRRLVDDL